VKRLQTIFHQLTDGRNYQKDLMKIENIRLPDADGC
jgi:hypothetical protein